MLKTSGSFGIITRKRKKRLRPIKPTRHGSMRVTQKRNFWKPQRPMPRNVKTGGPRSST